MKMNFTVILLVAITCNNVLYCFAWAPRPTSRKTTTRRTTPRRTTPRSTVSTTTALPTTTPKPTNATTLKPYEGGSYRVNFDPAIFVLSILLAVSICACAFFLKRFRQTPPDPQRILNPAYIQYGTRDNRRVAPEFPSWRQEVSQEVSGYDPQATAQIQELPQQAPVGDAQPQAADSNFHWVTHH